jgi:hypothetical protein
MLTHDRWHCKCVVWGVTIWHFISLISVCLHALLCCSSSTKKVNIAHNPESGLSTLICLPEVWCRVSLFVELNVEILTFCDTFQCHYFTLSWLASMNGSETKWLASQLPLLSCCLADHCQFSKALSVIRAFYAFMLCGMDCPSVIYAF